MNRVRYRVYRSRMRTHFVRDVRISDKAYDRATLCGTNRACVVGVEWSPTEENLRTERVDCARCIERGKRIGLMP